MGGRVFYPVTLFYRGGIISRQITFEELGIIIYNAKTKRPLPNCIFDKLNYESIEPFYKLFGYTFKSKDNKKHFLSMEEVQQLYKEYVKEVKA